MTDVYAPTYPSLYGGGFPLDLKIALQLGGTWTDITNYAYNRSTPAFTVTRGRPDETSQVSPSQMTGQLNNRDGRFTSRNPVGPYYGQLGRNTPVRLSVPARYATLRIEDDTVSAAAAAFTPITGDIDVRLELDLSGWAPANLISNWPNWALVLNGDGTLGWWIDQSSVVTVVASTMPLPAGHGAVRVTRAHSTGVVTFYTSGTLGGSWTQLGAAVTSVTGNLGSTAGSVIVGYDAGVTGQDDSFGGPSGRFYDAQVLSGIGGTIEAQPAFTSQAEGTASWTDAQSNSWAVTGTATIDGRSYRYHGEMSSLPVAWDPSGRDIWVPFTAGGILRRLQQGTSPVRSPMFLYYTTLGGSKAPVAYWPCEDDAGSTQIASGLAGGPAMAAGGATVYGADSTFVCSAGLPTMNGATWNGNVPAYPAATSFAVRFLTVLPVLAMDDTGYAAIITTNGTYPQLRLNYIWSGAGQLWVDDPTVTINTSTLTVPTGVPLIISVEVTPSGGSIVVNLNVLEVGTVTVLNETQTVTGHSGNVTAVKINGDQTFPGGGQVFPGAVPGGHIAVQTTWDALTAVETVLEAWAGETAGNRFVRICAEQGLTARIYGYPGVSQVMGRQPIDTLTNLLQACEDSDQGMLYEPSECLGVGYRTLGSICNQDPAVTLDYSAAEVGDQENSPVSLTSVDDDQYTRNDITITRSSGSSSGSSYQAQLDDGSAMSVSAPPAGVGDYNNSKTINLNADSQLKHLAEWLVHIGTVSEERYPQVVTGLHRLPIIEAGLGYTIQEVRIGDFVEIVNPPAWLPPGDIRQVVAGVSETLTSFLFQVSWNAIPESPYETVVADDVVLGRADTDGSTLHANLTSGAASMTVDTANGTSPLWTTTAGDFPLDISLGGEQITVTNISGSSSPQTFTITRSVNGVVKAHTAGDDIRLFYPPIAALT